MNVRMTVLGSFLLVALSLLSGCVTGIVERPDLKKLSYDSKGNLMYNGQEVEGIKLRLPWYQEMWPDNAPEWGFTLCTVGLAGAAGSMGGGGGGGEGSTEPDSTTTTTPTSRPSSGGTTTTTPTDGGGGGGGGDETPF